MSYHGVVYTEALGAGRLHRPRAWCRCATPAPPSSPFNAFLILQGIETLALRLDRISSNALAGGAAPARTRKAVNWVNYAALEDHPDHALVQKYLGGQAPAAC